MYICQFVYVCLGRKCVCMNDLSVVMWLYIHQLFTLTIRQTIYPFISFQQPISFHLTYLTTPPLSASLLIQVFFSVSLAISVYFFFFFNPNELFLVFHLISHISVLQYVSFPCSSSTYFDVLRSAYPLNLLKKSACLPSCCVPPCTSLRPPSLPLPTPLFTARQPYMTCIDFKTTRRRKKVFAIMKKKIKATLISKVLHNF